MEEIDLRQFKIKDIAPDATILVLGKRRSGKSSAKGTEVLMFDGTIKKVEEIKVGDQVMGDDSTPRNVLETHSGTDKMYKVTNKKGESYTVNSHHILSLVYSGKKIIVDRKDRQSYQVRWFDKDTIKITHNSFSYKNKDKELVLLEATKFFDEINDDRYVDIPIKKFMKLSKKYKENLLGYQVNPIEFPEKELPIDPYMIGYWLGDGTASNSNITSQDSSVLKYFAKNLPKYNLFLEFKRILCYKISSGYGQKKNIFLQTIKDLKMINNKHIPMNYKCNSRENRLKLLAGFIDADGHYGKRNEFEITQCLEHEKLLDDIIYLARSLGFSCYKHIKKTSWVYNGEKKYGEAIRIHINGKGIEESPTLCPRKQARPRADRVDALVSGIDIEEQPEGEYYGIELDGNNRYVLGNFIVTHNSWLIRDIFYHLREIPSGIIISGTEKASPFFNKFIPESFIYSEYDPNVIDNIMDIQEAKIRKRREKLEKLYGNTTEVDPKTNKNNMFIVLDDMMDEAQNWKKEKTIKRIFFNGRHYNIFCLIALQYPMAITPDLRNNADYVFVYAQSSMKNKRKIYDEFCGMVTNFDQFCNILDACTQNYECLVIKTTGNTNDIRDQIFWYKAKKQVDFRVGDPRIWEYHDNNFNKNHVIETEKMKEGYRLTQKKYGGEKTKKLKIFVTKNGEYIRHEKHEK